MARNCHSKSDAWRSRPTRRCLRGHGDTVILVTTVLAEKAREGLDFFPLLVDYEERLLRRGQGPRRLHQARRPSVGVRDTQRAHDSTLHPLALPRMDAPRRPRSRDSHVRRPEEPCEHTRHQRRVARARNLRHPVERPDRRGAHRLPRREARRQPRRERPSEQHARPSPSPDTAAASRWSRPEPKKYRKSCS